MRLFSQRKHHTKKSLQGGNAMLLVMLMSVFSMGIWAVTLRSTRDAIDTEEFHNQHAEFEQRIVQGLAMAGELLEDGAPSTTPFSFLYTGQGEKGPFYTRVEIRRKGNGKFAVSARAATSGEVRGLPRNPKKF